MLYIVELPVPPNTLESNPESAEFNPTEAKIVEGSILWDLNTAHLAGARILDRNSRIVPAPNSHTGWVTGDGEPVPFSVKIPLSGPPYRVRVEAYNLDDTYERTVRVRFQIENVTLEDLIRDLIGAMEVRHVYELEQANRLAGSAADLGGAGDRSV